MPDEIAGTMNPPLEYSKLMHIIETDQDEC